MEPLRQRKLDLLDKLDEDVQLFAFVHCVADKKLWFEIDTVPTNQYVSLLPKEDEDRLGEVTPYIVALSPNDEFTDWILANKKLMKDAFFVTSKQPLEQFSEKFKNLIYCYDDEGKKFYFGFYTAGTFSTYMDYLKTHEPAQCRGLLSGIETLYFDKSLLTKGRRADKAVYCSFSANDFVEDIEGDEQHPSSYLAPAFFEYFSKTRVVKYKEKIYQNLISKYPDKKYSTQDKQQTLGLMDEIIKLAEGYKITDEDAVKNLFEASWILEINVMQFSDVETVLKPQHVSQYKKAENILMRVKEKNNG